MCVYYAGMMNAIAVWAWPNYSVSCW